MAVDLAPPRRYTRSATGVGFPLSACCWFRADDVDAGTNSSAGVHTIFYQGTTSYGGCIGFYVNNGELAAYVDLGGGDNVDANLAILPGKWYFGAITYNNSTQVIHIYKRDEGQLTLDHFTTTLSGEGGAGSSNHMAWGGAPDGADQQMFNGALAYCRLFPGTLSEAQFLAESKSSIAVATEHADWPLASVATVTADVSGNSRTLTATGSGTISDTPGPLIIVDEAAGSILNFADSIRLGTSVVDKMMLGTVQVWP